MVSEGEERSPDALQEIGGKLSLKGENELPKGTEYSLRAEGGILVPTGASAGSGGNGQKAVENEDRFVENGISGFKKSTTDSTRSSTQKCGKSANSSNSDHPVSKDVLSSSKSRSNKESKTESTSWSLVPEWLKPSPPAASPAPPTPEERVKELENALSDETQKVNLVEKKRNDLVDHYNNLVVMYETKLRELQNVNQLHSELLKSYSKLQKSKKELEDELKDEKNMIDKLKQDIRDQEDVVTKAHSTAISFLAHDVSSDFPDDEVRGRFRTFFQEDFLGWCMDNRIARIECQKKTEDLLIKQGILWNDPESPEALRFDIGQGTAPAILLQAVLARELCMKFLSYPFFLVPMLKNLNVETLGGENPEARVAWRIQTCQVLEQAFPPTRQSFVPLAKEFAKTYTALLRPLERESIAELIDLFETFAKLALRLWKLKTRIKLEGLPYLRRFKGMHADMEAHSTVGILAGDKELDGRPICVLVQPCIVSEPILEGRSKPHRIVWSKASVWVSNWENSQRYQGEPMDGIC